MVAIGDGGEDIGDRVDVVVEEEAAHFFPQLPLGASDFQGAPEDAAADLLDLIDQERQHHQHREHDGEILFAMAEVVFEVISLVLERVEGLVFDLPSATASAHDRKRALSGDFQVRDPGEVLTFLSRGGAPNNPER